MKDTTVKYEDNKSTRNDKELFRLKLNDGEDGTFNPNRIEATVDDKKNFYVMFSNDDFSKI